MKKIHDITEAMQSEHAKAVNMVLAIDKEKFANNPNKLKKLIADKEKQMNAAAKILDFESAAILRDELTELQKINTKNAPKEEPL